MGLAWSPLQTSSRPCGDLERARGTIATPLLRIGGAQMGACSELAIHHRCHSLLGRNPGLVHFRCDETAQTLLRNLTNSGMRVYASAKPDYDSRRVS